MENMEIAQNKPDLEFLSINKGDTYTIEQDGETYEVQVNKEPTKDTEIELRRVSPGALGGKLETVSLDELNQILVRKEG